MRDMLLRDVKHSFHPIGCGSPGAVMDHELGHQIDSLLGLTNRETTQYFKDEELKKIWARTKKAGITLNLSEYGASKKSEFLAEAWSEYVNNPNPRKAAKEFGDRIKQLYAEKYP
jgi:hypothetical protein